MDDATSRNEDTEPRYLDAAEVAALLRSRGVPTSRNFVLRNYAEAGCRPIRGQRKALRFAPEDVASLVEWMRDRPARGQQDPATLTTRRSSASRRGRAA